MSELTQYRLGMAHARNRPEASASPPAREHAASSRSRHPPHRAVSDLDDIYRRLAMPRTQQDLADYYRAALRQSERLPGPGAELARPIPRLAAAIAPSATVNTAIHTLHVLPQDVGDELAEQLLEIAQRNVVKALGCCERALELDGADHGYDAEEWLPTVCDIARALLQSARLDTGPPTLVEVTQEAISWLSRAIAELDDGSEEAPTSLAETLARLLATWTFTDVALRHRRSE
jgi:hypothetical protein